MSGEYDNGADAEPLGLDRMLDEDLPLPGDNQDDGLATGIEDAVGDGMLEGSESDAKGSEGVGLDAEIAGASVAGTNVVEDLLDLPLGEPSALQGQGEGEEDVSLLDAIEGEDTDAGSEYGWTEDCEESGLDWGQDVLDDSGPASSEDDGAEGIEDLPEHQGEDDETDLPRLEEGAEQADEDPCSRDVEPALLPDRGPPLSNEIGSNHSS